jgi:hypothetical protein
LPELHASRSTTSRSSATATSERPGGPGEHLLIGRAVRDEQELIAPPVRRRAVKLHAAQQAPDLDGHDDRSSQVV